MVRFVLLLAAFSKSSNWFVKKKFIVAILLVPHLLCLLHRGQMVCDLFEGILYDTNKWFYMSTCSSDDIHTLTTVVITVWIVLSVYCGYFQLNQFCDEQFYNNNMCLEFDWHRHSRTFCASLLIPHKNLLSFDFDETNFGTTIVILCKVNTLITTSVPDKHSICYELIQN